MTRAEIKWVDDKDIFGRIFVLTNNPLFTQLRNAIDNEGADLTDAFSWGQLKSKRWLVNELEKMELDLGTIFLCAGWYATLAPMLFDSKCKISKIRSFDIDDLCVAIADAINATAVNDNWRFKACTQDIFDINYNTHTWQVWSKTNNRMCYPITDIPTTIINTSCEHIKDFDKWYNLIPAGKIVVLQTNNYLEVEDHVNCSSTLEEFAKQTPMSTMLYAGELQLEKYTRFMRVGIK
jgi:hypothetical protein